MLAPIACACVLAFAPGGPEVHPVVRNVEVDPGEATRVSLTLA